MKVAGKIFISKMVAFMFLCMMALTVVGNVKEVKVFADEETTTTAEEETTTKKDQGINGINVEYETDEDGNLILKSSLEENSTNSWNSIINKFHNQIIGISGVAAVVFIALFIKYFIELGSSASNPSKRSSALTGILFCGIATALFGGITIIMSISYYFIR